MGKNEEKNLLLRPPIVVVMGHIDHGKTSLLDFIRRTNVVSKAARDEPRPIVGREAGGITQSIGAYEIEHNGKKITFVDTPGHEAFSKMRARGAKVADLGILVVAADEGVKPQTEEAIKVLRESETPFVVAINKIDKANADIEKVKQELMQSGVLLEGFGGNISWQAISSKNGEGINELLDLILLAAELEGLTYDPQAKASGVILESKMDSRRGLTATAIVKNGTLRVGDEIATSSATGKVKIMENFLGKRVNELLPSSPVLILGFENSPQIGEDFFSGKVESAEIESVEETEIPQKVSEISSQIIEKPKPAINIVLKTDVSGSLEALCGIIKTLPDVKIISESIGDITDGDVKSALSTKAAIIGFKVRVSKAAENLAKAQDIKIITSEVIYELIKNLESEIELFKGPAIIGKLEILAVFGKKSGKQQIIGGRVTEGVLKNNSRVEIQRQEQIVGQGKIINLQKQKSDVSQVNVGEECGLLLESDIMVNVGDYLVVSEVK